MSDTPAEQEAAAETAAPEPVRVAWVAGPRTFEEYARVLQPLAIGLMDEVVEVVIVCPASGQRPAIESAPFEVIPCPQPRWWGLRAGAIEPAAAELRRRKVDLLHGLDASAAVLTRALARRAGVGYLLSSYSVDDAWRLGEAGRGALGLLAASEPIRQALISHGAAPPGRVHLMRPGVYHVRRATCFSDPDHSTAILAGGTLDDQAALEAVLLCFSELVARKLDCVFFIMGAGRCERRLRRRAEELNLRHHLTFTDCPPMGALTDIFQAADVYVAATGQDQIDIRSLLAMAAGVPVLAAGGDGVSDFLRDGETVMSFTPGDAGELTVKLAALLEDRASARALADSAIQYIHDNHSPAANVAALARICRQSAAEAVTLT